MNRTITRSGLPVMSLLHYYRRPGLLPSQQAKIKEKLQLCGPRELNLLAFDTEYCFNVQLAPSSQGLSESHKRVLKWLLSETWQPELFSSESFLVNSQTNKNKPSPSFFSSQTPFLLFLFVYSLLSLQSTLTI